MQSYPFIGYESVFYKKKSTAGTVLFSCLEKERLFFVLFGGFSFQICLQIDEGIQVAEG